MWRVVSKSSARTYPHPHLSHRLLTRLKPFDQACGSTTRVPKAPAGVAITTATATFLQPDSMPLRHHCPARHDDTNVQERRGSCPARTHSAPTPTPTSNLSAQSEKQRKRRQRPRLLARPSVFAAAIASPVAFRTGFDISMQALATAHRPSPERSCH